MRPCPVCGKQHDTQPCPTCGFDGSQHYEGFPTLMAIPIPCDAVSAIKSAYEMTLGLPICPVCQKPTPALLCPHCGFDGSSNFEQYLTLEPIDTVTPSVSRRRNELPVRGMHRLRCMKCGGTTFSMDLRHPALPWMCAACGAPLPKDACQNQQDEYIRAQVRSLPKLRRFIAAGGRHGVVLHTDGTVTAFGDNEAGQCETSSWNNVVAVSAGHVHTVGLRFDGTVVATGSDTCGQCRVENWENIVAIASGAFHTVGLRADGTVVAAAMDAPHQRHISSFSDVTEIFAGLDFTAARRSDGTFQSCGKNSYHIQSVLMEENICPVCSQWNYSLVTDHTGAIRPLAPRGHFSLPAARWPDIVALAPGKKHIVGLHSNGTVTARGDNTAGQCNVTSWQHIVAIAAGDGFTMGLKDDGSIVTVGEIRPASPLSILK